MYLACQSSGRASIKIIRKGTSCLLPEVVGTSPLQRAKARIRSFGFLLTSFGFNNKKKIGISYIKYMLSIGRLFGSKYNYLLLVLFSVVSRGQYMPMNSGCDETRLF